MAEDESNQSADLTRGEVLLVEYEQAGEAFRTQGSLLHRLYYLSAVVFTFLVGSIANLFLNDGYVLAGVLSLIGSLSFLLLGFGGQAYHRRRRSASIELGRVTVDLNSYWEENPLQLNKRISGGDDNNKKRLPELILKKLYRVLYLASVVFLILGIGILAGIIRF